MKRKGRSRREGQRGQRQNDADRRVLTREKGKRLHERDVECQTKIESKRDDGKTVLNACPENCWHQIISHYFIWSV